MSRTTVWIVLSMVIMGGLDLGWAWFNSEQRLKIVDFVGESIIQVHNPDDADYADFFEGENISFYDAVFMDTLSYSELSFYEADGVYRLVTGSGIDVSIADATRYIEDGYRTEHVHEIGSEDSPVVHLDCSSIPYLAHEPGSAVCGVLHEDHNCTDVKGGE